MSSPPVRPRNSPKSTTFSRSCPRSVIRILPAWSSFTRVSSAKRPVRTAANATKIRLSTRFFCMIFSLDPMVPPFSFGMCRSSARQDRVRGECDAFLHIFFPRDTRIVHTLFTPNLGSLKESTLYFSHSLKQRATNKKFWGPLSTSPNGQSGRPRKTPRRGVMIKIKDQCKQTAPARVFHLSLAGAAFYILSLIRCGGLFKFCRDLLEQFADGEVLRADLFALAAL